MGPEEMMKDEGALWVGGGRGGIFIQRFNSIILFSLCRFLLLCLQLIIVLLMVSQVYCRLSQMLISFAHLAHSAHHHEDCSGIMHINKSCQSGNPLVMHESLWSGDL